jgi:hypothetical protein
MNAGAACRMKAGTTRRAEAAPKTRHEQVRMIARP